MKTATIRDLRTRFPKIRRVVEQEGQIVVTDRGRPVMLLKPYDERTAPRATKIDYYARLRRRMPTPLTRKARERLDETNRGER